MGKKPQEFKQTILFLANILKNHQYAFRGTASLVLQDLDMNVDDIDILCDKETALACNKLLNDYLVEKVKYSKSDKFKSYYGKFKVNDIQVEIMGKWQIKDTKGKWSKPFDASEDEMKLIKLEDKEIPVTTVETELSMFAKMGRWNAYQKLRKQFVKPSKEQRRLF